METGYIQLVTILIPIIVDAVLVFVFRGASWAAQTLRYQKLLNTTAVKFNFLLQVVRQCRQKKTALNRNTLHAIERAFILYSEFASENDSQIYGPSDKAVPSGQKLSNFAFTLWRPFPKRVTAVHTQQEEDDREKS